jgi:hypothetical protein
MGVSVKREVEIKKGRGETERCNRDDSTGAIVIEVWEAQNPRSAL